MSEESKNPKTPHVGLVSPIGQPINGETTVFGPGGEILDLKAVQARGLYMPRDELPHTLEEVAAAAIDQVPVAQKGPSGRQGKKPHALPVGDVSPIAPTQQDVASITAENARAEEQVTDDEKWAEKARLQLEALLKPREGGAAPQKGGGGGRSA